jgi:hypothetical protein
MSIQRGIDGSEPVRPESLEQPAGPIEKRRTDDVWRLGTGTLACPACDAPVAPAPGGPMSPSDDLSCPVCFRAGAVRDFLSLAAPSRPARVEVRVVPPTRRRRPAAPAATTRRP